MSATGNGLSVISIGVSCQTSWQIRVHSELISQLTNVQVDSEKSFISKSSFPLDWRITPPSAFCRMAALRSMFPARLDEVAYAPNGAGIWEGSYFYHDKINEETFSTVHSKFRYTEGKLLSTVGRRVFVISNTQNNLDNVTSLLGVDFTFTTDLINSVAEAIGVLFPDGKNEFIIVTSEDRCAGDVSDWRARTYFIDRTTLAPNDIYGDTEQWGKIFRDYFSGASTTMQEPNSSPTKADEALAG